MTRLLAFIAACLLGYWASLLQQLPAQASPENHLQERILHAAAALPMLLCCAGLLWYALLREYRRNNL